MLFVHCTYKNTEKNIEYCGNHTTCCIYVALKYNAPPFKNELKALKNELNREQMTKNREIEQVKEMRAGQRRSWLVGWIDEWMVGKMFEFWVLSLETRCKHTTDEEGDNEGKGRKDNNSICRRTAYFADSLSSLSLLVLVQRKEVLKLNLRDINLWM